MADDSLHAIDVDDFERCLPAPGQVFIAGTDEPVVMGVAREISAVAVRDGERGSRRRTFLGNVVGEPIQAETRHDRAVQTAVGSMKC